MGTKNNPGQFDCEAKAEPNEPKFTLLARDPDAGRIVRMWAWGRLTQINRGTKPASDLAMVEEARKCADEMDAWFKANRSGELETVPSKEAGEASMRANTHLPND